MQRGPMTGELHDAENPGLVTGVTRRRHRYHPERTPDELTIAQPISA
jgi:hypothetical protein